MKDRCKHRTGGEGNEKKNYKHLTKDTEHSTMSYGQTSEKNSTGHLQAVSILLSSYALD
jgi:hypothetical protein